MKHRFIMKKSFALGAAALLAVALVFTGCGGDDGDPTGGGGSDASILQGKLVAAGITGATLSGDVVTIPATASLNLASYDGGNDLDVKPDVTLKIVSGATLTLTDTSGSNSLYLYGGGTLTVDGTLILPGDFLESYSTSVTDNATINGAGTIKLSAASTGGLLSVNNEQVTLTDVTLEGLTTNTVSLVYVGSSDTLTMTGTAKIKGNNSNINGGGVYVANGTFIMNDTASVESNTATSAGAGVYVSGGTFTMNGSATVKNKALFHKLSPIF
jgi:hypothetical protein